VRYYTTATDPKLKLFSNFWIGCWCKVLDVVDAGLLFPSKLWEVEENDRTSFTRLFRTVQLKLAV